MSDEEREKGHDQYNKELIKMSKINRHQKGLIVETIDDPVFKTIEMRSRPFGKGLGGGGGKYFPGHSLQNKLDGIQIVKNKNRSRSITHNRDF